MGRKNLTLFVEGSVDKIVVEHFFELASFSKNADIEIIECGGKSQVLQRVDRYVSIAGSLQAGLVDSDSASVSDSIASVSRSITRQHAPIFCAIPSIESWMFADFETAIKAARSDLTSGTIIRTALPESIPYPKTLAWNAFRRRESSNALGELELAFLKQVDLSLAASRSPSLRIFLLGISDIIGAELKLEGSALRSSAMRDAFSTLLRELPNNEVVWKTLDGNKILAKDMVRAVGEGTEIGLQYATEVLRIARDMIARRAKK